MSAPVELEVARLESLVSLVWDPGHYSPTCECQSCDATREHLSDTDLHFVNHLADTVGNDPRTS